MRAGTWFKRASILLLLLAFVEILVKGAELLGAVLRYRAEPRAVQEEYDRMAEAVARRFAADPNLPDVSRPSIQVSAEGPDLKIEAGYLAFQSASRFYGKEGEYTASISDYTAGGYRLSAAPNAYVVVEALTAGMDEFLDDRTEGNRIDIEVLGNADGLPVKSRYIYSGDLGTISSAPYFSYNTQRVETMNLMPAVTRHSNNSIAFLRALDVLRVISQSQYLAAANTTLSTYVNPEIGAPYRRVILRVTVKNALAEEYNEIPATLRKILVPN